VAIVKVALRQREQLATLRVRDGVLVLNTMLWPDEVRTPDFAFLDDDIEVRPPELAMAGSLIDSMAGEFDPEQYTDNYRAALQEVIDAKVEGREIVSPEEPEAAPTAAVDLMAALKASVERAKAARGESAPAPTPAKKAPAKKATAKKAPAAKKATPAKKAVKKSA
jgi:DNA end-binding protein Ku